MLRYLLLIFIYIKMCSAITSIGISSLYYPSVNESSIISVSESGLSDTEDKFNQLMISQVKTKIITVKSLLNQTLMESRAFTIFDGDKTISSWNATESNLLASWEYESDTSGLQEESGPESLASGAGIKPLESRYLLVGFIKSISVNEAKQIFPGAPNLSILYSLNIEIRYKLIDMNNKKVLIHFIAAGHGGIARIISSDMTVISQKQLAISNDIVTEAINSLVLSVKHGLLIKQSLGVISH